MKIENISKKYNVRALDSGDIGDVLELCSNNRLYYQYCPPHITRDGVIEDMEALPPGKEKRDKHFLGFFENDLLIAVLDLIEGYPDVHTYYIGLFMMNIKIQGQGEGTKIINELCLYLSEVGVKRLELAWMKGNPQAERFWKKNKFVPIEERSSNAAGHVIVAERHLN